MKEVTERLKAGKASCLKNTLVDRKKINKRPTIIFERLVMQKLQNFMQKMLVVKIRIATMDMKKQSTFRTKLWDLTYTVGNL